MSEDLDQDTINLLNEVHQTGIPNPGNAPESDPDEDVLSLINEVQETKRVLPAATAAAFRAHEKNLNDPNLPEFAKKLSETSVGLVGAAEETLLAAGGSILTGIGNARDLINNGLDIISEKLNNSQDPKAELLTSDGAQIDESFLDKALAGQREFKRQLPGEDRERFEKGQERLRTGLSLLPAVGIGAKAKGITQVAAASGLGGSAFTLSNELLDENGEVRPGELAKKVATSGAIGAAAGGLLAGVTSLGRAVGKIFGFGVKKQQALDLADVLKTDDQARANYELLTKAGLRPTVADLKPGNQVFLQKLKEAAPLSGQEKQLVQEITERNMATLQQNFQRDVIGSLDDVIKNPRNNILANDMLIQHADDAMITLRRAANAAPRVRDVYDKVDSGIALPDKVKNILTINNPTNPALVRLQQTYNDMIKAVGKGARSETSHFATLDDAIAAHNRVGNFYNTKHLDVVVKDLSRQNQAARLAGDSGEIAVTGKALKLGQKLLDDMVPGYKEVRKSLATLDDFPQIGANPTLSKHLSQQGEGSAAEMVKSIFNVKTPAAERAAALDFFTNGIRNAAGELVVPGNRPVLAAAIKNQLTLGLSKTTDINKNLAQIFTRAFQKSPADRAMWDQVFQSISGKPLAHWQKMTRVIDTVFAKYGDNIFNNAGGNNLLGLLTTTPEGSAIAATKQLITYMKRKALFNFMYRDDWAQAMEQAAKSRSFGSQVNTLAASITGGGLSNLLDPDDDPELRELLENVNRRPNGQPTQNKRTMRQRGF